LKLTFIVTDTDVLMW